jgi:probable rRNA maturation factor
MPASKPKAPRHRLTVLVEAARWRKLLPTAPSLVRRAARTALAAAGPDRPAELAIVLVDDRRQRALNKQWRGKDKSTNVLAFPGAVAVPVGTPLPLGDIVLAIGTIEEEADVQSKKLADHVTHLVIHGTLHLLGYDHDLPSRAKRMETLETKLLSQLRIADPYKPAGRTRAARQPDRMAAR